MSSPSLNPVPPGYLSGLRPTRHESRSRILGWCSLCCLVFLALPVWAGFKPGDALPDLAGFQLEGKLPERMKGKVILLDFWASWCAPCKRSFPVMAELQRKYGPQGLIVLAVNVDEKRADLERFLKNNPVDLAVVRDASQKLVAVADVPSMPSSFLVDRAGKIRFVHAGFHGDKTRKQYQEQIEILLKETAP